MIIKSSSYAVSAVREDQYPKDDLPEIALSGRSNVGKSSLINTLLNRKTWLEPLHSLVKRKP